MANESQPTVTAEQLMALRSGPDALRAISEALNVKRMGPADHIRTKHEVKAFLDFGDANSASKLVSEARERLNRRVATTNKITVTHSQGNRA